jgi:hypothetical protein
MAWELPSIIPSLEQIIRRRQRARVLSLSTAGDAGDAAGSERAFESNSRFPPSSWRTPLMETRATGKTASAVVSGEARAPTKTSGERYSLLEKLPLSLIAIHRMVNDHQAALDEELQRLIKAITTRLLEKPRDHHEPIIAELERRLLERLSKNDSEAKRDIDLAPPLARVDVVLSRFVTHVIIDRNKDRTAQTRRQFFTTWAAFTRHRPVVLRVATGSSCVTQQSQLCLIGGCDSGEN